MFGIGEFCEKDVILAEVQTLSYFLLNTDEEEKRDGGASSFLPVRRR